jgi:lysophospholipase L1-like esterase
MFMLARPHPPTAARTRVARGLTALALLIGSAVTAAALGTGSAQAAGHTALSRTGWTVSASASGTGDQPANMVDGDAATRWSTGTAMTPGQSLTVDMGAARSLDEITLDAGGSTGDYARGYQVYLSNDGTGWGGSVATGTGASALTDATFAARSARYVKVVQTGSAGNRWSVAEFNAYTTSTAATTRVGGWTAALAGGGNGVINQTIRMVVHTTVGGSAVRVRLSNLYGANPLPVGAVDVAVQSSGGNAVAGTHHAATFSGSATTTIPAGTEVAGDALDMTVTPEENLLVSVYYPGNAGASSWHYLASDTTYYSASGNFAADDTTANYPASDGAWYYVDGLDVESTTAQGTLVAFGDSITDGAGSTPAANSRWPNDLARRLQAQSGGPAFGVVDAGIGGNRLLTDTGDQFGTSALHRFAHDALGQPGVKAVILLEGINDIGVNLGPNGALTAQDLINGYQTLIQQAHAADVKIYGATILPFAGAGTYTSGGESIRETVNQWILTGGAFDGAFDLSSAMANPASPLQLNPAYDSGDHLHPNDAGYQAMANAVDLTKLSASAAATH